MIHTVIYISSYLADYDSYFGFNLLRIIAKMLNNHRMNLHNVWIAHQNDGASPFCVMLFGGILSPSWRDIFEAGFILRSKSQSCIILLPFPSLFFTFGGTFSQHGLHDFTSLVTVSLYRFFCSPCVFHIESKLLFIRCYVITVLYRLVWLITMLI